MMEDYSYRVKNIFIQHYLLQEKITALKSELITLFNVFNYVNLEPKLEQHPVGFLVQEIKDKEQEIHNLFAKLDEDLQNNFTKERRGKNGHKP